MILLTSSQSLEVALAGAVATTQPSFLASWVDENSTTFVLGSMGSTDGVTNNTTPVTMVAAPSAGSVRRVSGLCFYNNDTVAVLIDIKVNDSGNKRSIWNGLLFDGDTLVYSDGGGFTIINSDGEVRVSITNVAHHAPNHEAGGIDPIPLDTLASPTDTTTLNVSSTLHGLAPKSPADASKFLNGAATPAYAQVKDSDLSLSDITTNNASSTNHGFLPKLSNSVNDVLRGDGTYGKAQLAGGGTNADLSATGGTSQVLKQSSAGAAITVGTLASSNLSDASNIPLLNANNAFTGTGDTTFAGNEKFATTQNFSWNSKAANSQFTAASDGFVVATYQTSGTGEIVQIESPSGTVRVKGGNHPSETGVFIPVFCPVKKGDTWKVVSTGVGTFTQGPYWIPLGTAG